MSMTMSIVQFNFPTTIKYGPGAVRLLPEALREAGVARPLIVTDKGIAGLPPVTGPAQLLREAGLAVEVFGGIWGNPTASQAEAGAAAYAAHAADGIVAIGGGAALDVAKCVAVLAKHSGPLLAYDAFLAHPLPIDRDVPPIFTVPTTAGTGSEVGRSAVVSDDVTHQKKIVFSPKLLARRVFLDPELTLALPSKITAATGMDALTHCVESYLHAMFHPMCDGIALEGLRLIARSLPLAVGFARRLEAGDRSVLDDARHLQARGEMLCAAMMGAVAFQKDLGVVHSCAHSLSTVADLHHGLANGIMIVAGMRFNKPVSEAKMATMAVTVGAKDATADGFIAWLDAFRAEVGIPRSLRAVGVTDQQVAALVENALADACHTFNPRQPVTAVDFKLLFEEALG
jgi:alcohol dehydrogenase class IV